MLPQYPYLLQHWPNWDPAQVYPLAAPQAPFGVTAVGVEIALLEVEDARLVVDEAIDEEEEELAQVSLT